MEAIFRSGWIRAATTKISFLESVCLARSLYRCPDLDFWVSDLNLNEKVGKLSPHFKFKKKGPPLP
jgi:hypothetical protein